MRAVTKQKTAAIVVKVSLFSVTIFIVMFMKD